MSGLLLPRRRPGRQSAAAVEQYEARVSEFCAELLQIRTRLDFEVSARGWAYILEEHGLPKGDFDATERLITECRKQGLLPLDIVAEDDTRRFDGLEVLDYDTPEQEVDWIVGILKHRHLDYTPVSFWEDQDVYLQTMVEKIDLKSLFAPDCHRYYIPIANARGWSDLNSRAAMMRRFQKWETQGKQCVLLYCGDHDPVGLQISERLRANMADLAGAVGWSPDNLIIDRFGLNADFIETQNLTWIDGLETGTGRDLADPRHPDHHKSYVQNYLARFGARKVEANALVVRPEAGRQLCREAILRYLPEDAPDRYRDTLRPLREELRQEIGRLMDGAS